MILENSPGSVCSLCISRVFLVYLVCISHVFLVYYVCISHVFPVYFSCSGQSGSGKTEATKLIVGYLSFLYEGRNQRLPQVFTVLTDDEGFVCFF